MTRDIDDIANTILAPEIFVFFAVELMFDTTTTVFNGEEIDVGPLYLWTGLGDMTVDGQTYTGTGNMLGISQIKETADISAAGVSLSLSGIPVDIISMALNVPYHGRQCKIKFGVFVGGDLNNPALTTLFVGEIDQMNIDESPKKSTITLAVESKMIKLDQPPLHRYTSASQKSRYPGDLAFDFVPGLQDRPLSWGRSN